MPKSTTSLISFGSDNHSGVHPQILKALVSQTEKYAPSYETDSVSQELRQFLKKDWGCADSFLVFNGTAANVLCLSTALKSYHAVICTDVSHLNVDECGAPEKWVGAKLIPIPHQNGKIPISKIKDYLVRRGDQHCSQIKMISITQPTELGTVYSLEELSQIRELCDQENLFLHIDGARLGNACYSLGCQFKDILKFCDVASVGGAKNGLLAGELVIINKKELAENFKFLRKQALQLASKTRFFSAQFLSYLQNNLWHDIAQHQCSLAQNLALQISSQCQIHPNYTIESNAVFCNLPQGLIKPLREEFFFYVWNEHTFECRLMTSFATTQEEVDLFVIKLKTVLGRVEN